jgi:hypothetical protein
MAVLLGPGGKDRGFLLRRRPGIAGRIAAQRAYRHRLGVISALPVRESRSPRTRASLGYSFPLGNIDIRRCHEVTMRTKRELLYGWLLATLLSGIPSTLYALLTASDALEATRAAGAMINRPGSIAAAALVHSSVSLFWATVLWLLLPYRRTALWALLASMGIALLDLRVIAPAFFPEVAALAFWPQLADHLMWGACVGLAFQYGPSAHAPGPRCG